MVGAKLAGSKLMDGGKLNELIVLEEHEFALTEVGAERSTTSCRQQVHWWRRSRSSSRRPRGLSRSLSFENVGDVLGFAIEEEGVPSNQRSTFSDSTRMTDP